LNLLHQLLGTIVTEHGDEHCLHYLHCFSSNYFAVFKFHLLNSKSRLLQLNWRVYHPGISCKTTNQGGLLLAGMLRFLLNRALAHFQCPHISTNTILIREKLHAQLCTTTHIGRTHVSGWVSLIWMVVHNCTGINPLLIMVYNWVGVIIFTLWQ